MDITAVSRRAPTLEAAGSSFCRRLVLLAAIHCSRWRSSIILGWYSRVAEGGDWYTDWWSKCSSVWTLSLCGHKTGTFKHCKAVRF